MRDDREMGKIKFHAITDDDLRDFWDRQAIYRWRDMSFDCPVCGCFGARTEEIDVDIHSGAMFHCGECGEGVTFSVAPSCITDR